MIDLYTWPTPNGRKISIMLEELEVPYTVYPININNSEQFSKSFSQISPSNKIPAILDNENDQSIFESGAIMLYLANKYNKFIPQKHYWEVIEWLVFQLSQVGPLLGQAHQFLFYYPNQDRFVEEKYIGYAKRIYQTLDNRLRNYQYLATEYSIADISTWPWIARFERHRVSLIDYPNVLRWYNSIRKRSAVIKGYNVVGEKKEIPF
jgi:GST-like protein|tara:strand:- start:691 stop:1311 length:621 start_codon:yes stop_codon:yes gene_type:complete